MARQRKPRQRPCHSGLGKNKTLNFSNDNPCHFKDKPSVLFQMIEYHQRNKEEANLTNVVDQTLC